jgi:hypothetical protein
MPAPGDEKEVAEKPRPVQAVNSMPGISKHSLTIKRKTDAKEKLVKRMKPVAPKTEFKELIAEQVEYLNEKLQKVLPSFSALDAVVKAANSIATDAGYPETFSLCEPSKRC